MRSDQIPALDRDWSTRFPKRITKSQKECFLTELEKELTKRSFESERVYVRTFTMLNRNLVTKCERPYFIFMAHYDTPTRMPFWISWIYQLFGHTRQAASTIFVCALILFPNLLPIFLHKTALLSLATSLFYLAVLASMIPFAFPNPHNRDDNTSGIISLLALADWAKDKPEIKKHIQFAFLDNEEWGLLGSNGLRRRWNQQGYPYTLAAILNLDCIARGQKPLILYHKEDGLARRVQPFMQKYAPQVELLDLGSMPLSDNYTFRKEGAIDISRADPSIIPGGYQIRRIHTPADNDFSPSKIIPIVNGLVDFIDYEMLTHQI